MLTGEWKLEEALEVWRDEYFRRGVGIGREEGIGIGRNEGIGIGRTEGQNKVLDLMKQGYTAEQIEGLLAAPAPPQQ